MNIESLKAQAAKLRQLTLVVYFAARDPRMPFFVRLLAVLVAAYALSPIDLIPDFIPIIGLLDDIVLVPLGLALVARLTPPTVMASAQLQASKVIEKPVSYTAAIIIILIWLVVLLVLLSWVFKVVGV